MTKLVQLPLQFSQNEKSRLLQKKVVYLTWEMNLEVIKEGM